MMGAVESELIGHTIPREKSSSGNYKNIPDDSNATSQSENQLINLVQVTAPYMHNQKQSSRQVEPNLVSHESVETLKRNKHNKKNVHNSIDMPAKFSDFVTPKNLTQQRTDNLQSNERVIEPATRVSLYSNGAFDEPMVAQSKHIQIANSGS